MKIIKYLIGLILLSTCNTYAYQPTIDKGDGIDGYVVTVDSFSTNTIIDLTNARQANNTDYVLKNGGTISVWLDNFAAVVTSGTGEGYLLGAGESISVDGRVKAIVYGRTEAAASTCKVYVFMTYTTK